MHGTICEAWIQVTARAGFRDIRGFTVPNFIPIPGDSDDSRAVRTRAEIASALISLMHEKGFDTISVQQICARAHVGRSTFYAHFQDKDELLIRHIVVFGRVLGGQLAWDERNMKPVFDSLAHARKIEFVMKVWHNNIAEVFEQRVVAVRGGESRTPGIPAMILAQQLAGTLMTLMAWWMDHHYPLPEQEMEKQFQRLIVGLS